MMVLKYNEFLQLTIISRITIESHVMNILIRAQILVIVS